MYLDVFVHLPLKLCVRAVSRLRGRFLEFEQYACLQREAAVFSQPSTFHHSERNNDFSSKHPQDVDLSSTHPAPATVTLSASSKYSGLPCITGLGPYLLLNIHILFSEVNVCRSCVCVSVCVVIDLK